MILRIQNVNSSLAVARQCPRSIQLPLRVAGRAPSAKRVSIERELLNPAIAEFADVDISLAIEDQIIRILKLPQARPFFSP